MPRRQEPELKLLPRRNVAYDGPRVRGAEKYTALLLQGKARSVDREEDFLQEEVTASQREGAQDPALMLITLPVGLESLVFPVETGSLVLNDLE